MLCLRKVDQNTCLKVQSIGQPFNQAKAGHRCEERDALARQGKIPFQYNPLSTAMKFSKQYQSYQSDLTKFITELKQKNPNLDAQQRAGRALLWDKAPIDLDERKRAEASRVKQQAYVYQNKV
jgi:hypothetical protein